MQSQSSRHYDVVSRAFHWMTAVVVVVAFILGPEHFGRLMRSGLDPASRNDIVWHETLGIAVFVLTLLRLLWVAVRPAAPQFAMKKWMHLASKLGHLALWALMLTLPVSAILALGTEAHPLTLLGGVRLIPIPWVADVSIVKLVDWGDVHGMLGDAIVWLAAVHAAAAIYHHMALKDGVLVAMVPWLNKR